MAKYIDANQIYERFFNGGRGIARIHVSDIDTLPAADVEPVVHAHWIKKVEIVRNQYARNYYCSNCIHEPLEIGDRCPKCGAHMDGEA